MGAVNYASVGGSSLGAYLTLCHLNETDRSGAAQIFVSRYGLASRWHTASTWTPWTEMNAWKGSNTSFTTSLGVAGFYFEYDIDNTVAYIRALNTWYIRGAMTKNVDYADIVPENRSTTPKGMENCIALTTGQSIYYNIEAQTFEVLATSAAKGGNLIPIFVLGFYGRNKNYGIIGGTGQWMYQEYISKLTDKEIRESIKYGTDEYFKEAESLINKVLADRDTNTVTVAVGTDFHCKRTYDPSKQVEIFNRVAERCADFAVNLGDTINGRYLTLEENLSFYTHFWEYQKACAVPVMYCRGNHEMHGGLMDTDTSTYMNGDPSAIPLETVLGIPLRKNPYNVVYSAGFGNWYFDYNGIRFVGLDGAYKNNGGFNQEGISFLADALNTNNKIVVFSHFPANRYLNGWDRPIDNADAIETLVKNCDNVIAYIHGHTHWDNIYVVNGNGFPYICTCCALPEQLDLETYACSYGTPTNYERTKGSYSEYCFDVYNIHKNNGKINIYRFGAGTDRNYTPQ